MPGRVSRFKSIKTQLVRIFSGSGPEAGLAFMASVAPRELINPLFSLLLHPDPQIKWRTVQGFGMAVSRLAGEDMEAARIVVRRLMWQLNDESGGIGWGCPESLGEIVASHERLAEEFHQVLISYIRPEGNFLEYLPLRRGALWGVARAAEMRPGLMTGAAETLAGYCRSGDAEECALAARALGFLRSRKAVPLLEGLVLDGREVYLYTDGELRVFSVGGIAREALRRVEDS